MLEKNNNKLFIIIFIVCTINKTLFINKLNYNCFLKLNLNK